MKTDWTRYFALLLLVPALALAGKPKHPDVDIDVKGHQEQKQGQHQGQATEVNTKVNNEGNTLVAEGDEITLEGDSYDIPVSSAFAPPSYSHIRCDKWIGIGATRDDGSVAVGIPVPRVLSRKIRDCQRVDDSAWAQSLGYYDEAIAHRCGTKSMVKQYGSADDCVNHFKNATNYAAENERLRSQVSDLTKKYDDVQNLLVISEEHSEACDESLNRCEKKAFGEK